MQRYPPRTEIAQPDNIYAIKTSSPETPRIRNRATSFITADEIKKTTAMLKGMPEATKPINSGIAAQEQKGVAVPNKIARRYLTAIFLLIMLSCIF